MPTDATAPETPPAEFAAPDWAHLDTIWRNPAPFVLWPVGNRLFLDYWLDEAVRMGCRRVRLHVVDRPAEVREYVGRTGYWSLEIDVVAAGQEQDVPQEARWMRNLPGQPDPGEAPRNGRELLGHWFALQKYWLEHLASSQWMLSLHAEPSGWVGPRVKIHPRAVLHPPFWIGAQAEIGSGASVGPYALISERSIIDERAVVQEALVLADSYIGQMTNLEGVVVDGGVLMDIKRGVRVDIREHFILGKITEEKRTPSWRVRGLAFLLWLVFALPGWQARRRGGTSRPVLSETGETLDLFTASSGPLVVRRWSWLAAVWQGQLKIFGILPRNEEDFARLPPETADRLRAGAVGVFSLADLHGCYSVENPEEWIHAAYQVLTPNNQVKRLLWRNLWTLLWTQPNR